MVNGDKNDTEILPTYSRIEATKGKCGWKRNPKPEVEKY